MHTIIHQMRPWPPVWTRPRDDRPPFTIWPLAALGVWGVILAIVETSTTSAAQQRAFWFVFAGWCIGVLGATIAHYMYRR
jgi:hypothetical protein